jgi:DNA-binding transcriptional LysR family regulator
MSMAASWEDQRAFLAVMETGSLSAAARALGVAQPTVRTRIASLEQATGAVLFTRSSGGLTPTDLAFALMGHVRSMSSASEAFVRTASGGSVGATGTVRLSVSRFVGVAVIPAMLAELRDGYPKIAIELSLTDRSADVIGQEVDVAVRMHPPSQNALVAQKVGAIRLGLFASRRYLERRGVPQGQDDLPSHDLIGPDRARRDLDLARSLHPALTRSHFAVRTDDHPAQLALARAGLGIAVLQCAVAQRDPDLVRLLPDRIVAELPTWIVMHEDLRSVPRVRIVFDHLVASFRRYVETQHPGAGPG